MKKIGNGIIKIKDIKFTENSRLREKTDVSDLMRDIEQHGLLEPIGIRKEDNAIIFGNRRTTAYKKIGYNTIDCIYFSSISDSDLMVLNIVENIKRKSIGSIEIGRVNYKIKK